MRNDPPVYHALGSDYVAVLQSFEDGCDGCAAERGALSHILCAELNTQRPCSGRQTCIIFKEVD